MSIKSKAIGLLFGFSSVVCFTVNFHIFNPWLIGSITWLWNPLILFAPKIVDAIPNIPFVSAYVGEVVTYLLASLWSIILLAIGIAALRHKSKQHFPIQKLTPKLLS
jgi:hypothetical protein